MSASRERKTRAINKAVAQPTKKQEKKKISEGLIFAISIVLVLVAVFGTVLGIRYYQRNQVVMTVGDKDITVKEFNHFFNQTASNFSQNYGSYASYMGMDTTLAIDAQNISADSLNYMGLFGMDIDCLAPYKQETANEDGTTTTTYDITWAGYFALQARETAAQVWSVYQAAMADPNYTVPEEIETGIQNELLNIDLYASIYGMSSDKFIEAQYGDGCTKDTYEQHIRVSYVASDYASNYWYSADEINAEYDAAPGDFDVVTFMAYTVSSSEFLSTEEAEAETEATETETEATEEDAATTEEEAKAQAKAAAEAMEASFDVTNSSVSTYADYTLANAKAYLTEEAGTWLFETAKVGDVKLFANEDGTTYYVVKLLANDVNYMTSDFLQIFIAADEETGEIVEEDHEGHDHEETETTEETAATAAEKVEAVLAGLQADGSEESFRTLATEYDQSGSVELEDVAYAYLESSYGTEALTWVLEGCEAGEYKTFETTNGTYILYFLGASENSYRNLSVNAKMVSNWIDSLTETTLENCKFDMAAAMNGSVSLVMNTGSGY